MFSITSQYANFVYIVQVTSVSFYRTSLGKQRVEKPRWRRGRKQHKKKSRKTLISSEKPSTRELVPASALFARARMLSAACLFSRSERSRKSNSFARSQNNGCSDALLRSFFIRRAQPVAALRQQYRKTRALRVMLFSVAMQS